MDGNWRDRFEQGRDGRPAPPPPPVAEIEEESIAPDLSVYRPWIIQRGRTRPALLLNLRKFDPKSGFWIGWQAAYPHLVAADYVGERMLSLDFGARQFVIEGTDLSELLRHLQQGTVLAIQEYSSAIWPRDPAGPFVQLIMKVEHS
jgi:hypothetical protein